MPTSVLYIDDYNPTRETNNAIQKKVGNEAAAGEDEIVASGKCTCRIANLTRETGGLLFPDTISGRVDAPNIKLAANTYIALLPCLTYSFFPRNITIIDLPNLLDGLNVISAMQHC